MKITKSGCTALKQLSSEMLTLPFLGQKASQDQNHCVWAQ